MDGSHDDVVSCPPDFLLLCVFSFLAPKDLALAGTTCRRWHGLATRDSNKLWKGFFTDRWRVSTTLDAGSIRWSARFCSKMAKLNSWTGRWQQDDLFGHKAGVRALKMSQGLLATGSLDRTVRLWDLSSGLPLACTKPHKGTVRCVALDDALLISGSTDHTIHVYAAQGPQRFDLSTPHSVLRTHTGPVSSLCLTEQALYSGSWDCTVRTYSRHQPTSLEPSSLITYPDWVSAVAARGKHLLVAAGADMFCHDLLTGQLVRHFQRLHEGSILGVEGSQSSKLLFTAAAEGLVMATDLRMRNPACVVWHHTAGIQGLAFEDPWMACASSDGSVLMINTELQLRRPAPAAVAAAAAARRAGACRRLLAPSSPAYCVDIADQRLACGSGSPVVRVFDFTRAMGAADRAAAAKAARNSRKQGRRGSGQRPPDASPPPPAPSEPGAPLASPGAGGAGQGGGGHCEQGPWAPGVGRGRSLRY